MNQPIDEHHHAGTHHGWRYVVVCLALAFYWWGLSGLTVAIAQVLVPLNTAGSFIANSLPFVCVLGLLSVFVNKLHGQTLRSLINRTPTIDYKRIWVGFGVWGLLLASFTVLDIVTHSSDYRFTFDLDQWFPLLIVALILTPIQTSVEELLYRGYLTQGLGRITKNPLVLALIPSIAFAIPHFGNPEMARGFFWGAMTYLCWGIFFSTLTLKDKGLELSLGVHAANNLFAFLVVNTSDSVVITPAIFTYMQPEGHASEGFFGLLIYAGVFYAILFGGIPRSRPTKRFD
jgi:uncharacterized protein